MQPLWYRNAVIHQVDVAFFLAANCIWLRPEGA